MLFYCRFTWYPGTSREEVARRVVEQDGINNTFASRIKSWHTLVGGGAGFLMIEADKPQEISEILEPYMDLDVLGCPRGDLQHLPRKGG